MKKRLLFGKTYAVSGVIEALLLIALVAIIISTIQLIYIPDIMEDKEEDHMSEIEKQISYLKSNIDIQTMTKEKVLLSSAITLGNKQLPYFVTMGSTGQVQVNNKSDVGSCRIKTSPAFDSSDLPDFSDDFIIKYDGIPLTSIEYNAYNNYIDNYKYVFEGGAIVAKKPDEEMMVQPSIVVENTTDTKITLYYSLPFFTDFAGRKIESSGFGNPDLTVYIHTNYSLYNSPPRTGISSLQIHTNYIEAWNNSLIGNNGLLLSQYNNDDISITIHDTQEPAYIEISPNNKDIDLVLTVSKIGVQIGPGVVK